MSLVMIVSVGGSAEPIVKTLVAHRPSYVCFYCSESSVEKVGQIKELARAAGVEVVNANVIVPDPEDLVECYRWATVATERALGRGAPGDRVLVDFTGGTKTMSAAIALATVAKGVDFSYIGGTERTKNGVGTVVSGFERVRTGVSPWQIFAVDEKKAFANLFNRHLYASAEETIARAVPHAPDERSFLEALVHLTRGYRDWDAFQHQKARNELKLGVDALATWVHHRGADEATTDALATARHNLAFLSDLQGKTRGFQDRHRGQVVDLLSNARRRADVGRFDDAVARLYRALELVGQLAFEEAFGCQTGKALPDRLPDEIREEYRAKYASPEEGLLQIPLRAAFRALEAAGRDEGLRYEAHEEEFRKLLSARNSSILAHGFTPIAPDVPQVFESLLRQTFGIRETVEFPRFAF